MIGEMESISWTKIPIFLNMFPNAKALLIVRDLRDVVVSFKKKTIAPGYDYLIALFNVINAMDSWLKYQSEFPNRFHGVRFEELKMNPRKKLKRMFFWELVLKRQCLTRIIGPTFMGINGKTDRYLLLSRKVISKTPWTVEAPNYSRGAIPLEWIGGRQMTAFNLPKEGGNVSKRWCIMPRKC